MGEAGGGGAWRVLPVHHPVPQGLGMRTCPENARAAGEWGARNAGGLADMVAVLPSAAGLEA